MVKILLAAVALLALSATSFGLAVDFNDRVTISTMNESSINIKVYSFIDEKVSFSLFDGKPWMFIDRPQAGLEKDRMQMVRLYMSPANDVTLGTYRVGVIASGSSGDVVRKDLLVTVVKGEGATVDKTVITGDLTPKGEVEIRTYVTNDGLTTLQDVTLTADVTSPDGKNDKIENFIEQIDPGETKVAVNFIKLGELAAAGEYTVEGALKRNDKVDSMFSQSFVVAKRAIVEETRENFGILFGFGKRITLRNLGNDKSDDLTVSDDVGAVNQQFYSGDSPQETTAAGIQWLVTGITPGEERTITYYVNYTPLIAFFFAALLAGWFYLEKIRTVRLKKYIMMKKDIVDGEEYTMAIEMKNMLPDVKNIEVKDFVPSAFRVTASKGLKPEITKTKIGTKLSWSIDSLKKGDNVVLNYKVRPMFGVNGQIRMPRCRIHFSRNNRNRMRLSNIPLMGNPLKTGFQLPQMPQLSLSDVRLLRRR